MEMVREVSKLYWKYDDNGYSVINEIKRISKPGRRVYKGADDIRSFKNGYGTLVVSTNKGVIANDEVYNIELVVK